MLKNRKILIVDDDQRNIFALKTVLKSMGAKCISAENGKEGIEVLKMNPDSDIVLMDMMMPVMDGYEAIWWIKKENTLNSIPVIALTAKAMKGDREKCLAAGADDYVPKPVIIEELIRVMEKHLNGMGKNSELQSLDS